MTNKKSVKENEPFKESLNYELTAELLYGDMLIQKWTPENSTAPVRMRFALEDGTRRTSSRRRPQGPVLLVSKSVDHYLEFGIEDPSGLSIRSTGLVGQFLGCIRYRKSCQMHSPLFYETALPNYPKY